MLKSKPISIKFIICNVIIQSGAKIGLNADHPSYCSVLKKKILDKSDVPRQSMCLSLCHDESSLASEGLQNLIF